MTIKWRKCLLTDLTLSKALTIIDASLAKGGEIDARPLTVAVLDAGGHLVALQRQDGSSTLRPDLAQAKAAGAIGMGVSSRSLAKMAAERPQFMDALATLAKGRMMPAPGGVLVRDGDGRVIGAVGITGDTSDRDETCAIAGIEAAGLTADAA